MGTAGRKRKNRQLRTPPLHPTHVFPLLLAAASSSTGGGRRPPQLYIIKRCLKAHLTLLNSRHLLTPAEAIPSALLSLLPLFLRFREVELATITAEIVGAAALSSLEANERIVADEAVVAGIVAALRSESAPVVEAVASAILDLSSSSIGRERLGSSPALVELIALFNARAAPFTVPDALERSGAVNFDNNQLLVMLLDAVIILINACSSVHLENIPKEMAYCFLVHLRGFWVSIRDSWFVPESSNCIKERWMRSRHFKAVEVAEALFKLSMCHTNIETCACSEVVDSVFGGLVFDFQHFVSSTWEESPVLLKQGAVGSLCNTNGIFDKLAGCLKGKEIDLVLDCILGGLVSCPPLGSDELDIDSFLEEAKGDLGISIVYGRDIRVVRTVKLTSDISDKNMKSEMHFFADSIDSADVSADKLKESYFKGFTIAIRGMEFRSQVVASLANSLAMLFGQPAVGANLYLTPPRAQGLICHYDDHCVFIFQIVGCKKWVTFPGKRVSMPRLYEPLQDVSNLDDSCHQIDSKEYLLKEGDILYIPRGCPHEAHTISCADDTFSLHLTFGIEVEPHFAWEGFIHVALHCWSRNLRTQTAHPIEVNDDLHKVLVILLHISIKLIADRNFNFRKACMVGSLSDHMSSEDHAHLSVDNMKQRETFSYLLDTIGSDSEFNEVLSNFMIAASGNKSEYLQWMIWLRHLYQDGEEEEMDINNSLRAFEKVMLGWADRLLEVEEAFVRMKDAFCRDASYSDVCMSFKKLLQQYRTSRLKYMAGMLSLHCK